MKWITVVIARFTPLLSTAANFIPADGAAKGTADGAAKGTADGAAKGTADGAANSTATWDKLQINLTRLCAMPYGNFRVPVYGYSNNSKWTDGEKRYFYKPIALLDHRSAISTFNDVTQESQMRFKIHMWNDEVEEKVTQHVSKVVNHKVQPHQVEVMDLEKVMLTSGSEKPSKYTVKNNWMLINNRRTMEFFVTCLQQSDCDQLADNMRTSPEKFEHFQLLFSCDSLEKQTRETVIRIDSIVKGGMVAKLIQRFPKEDEILLTANDVKKLLAESSRQIFVEASDDTPGGFPPDFEEQITRKLKELLIASSDERIKELSSGMWESVFWNEDNYRPDKASKTLNDYYQKFDKDKQNKLVESFKKSNKVVAGTGAGHFLLGQVNVDADFSRHGDKSEEDLDKLVQESKAHVEWNGEKFIPKPLSLSRISLSKLRDTQLLQDKRVRLLNSTVLLSTNINYDNEGKDEKRLFDLVSRTSSSVKEIEALVGNGVNINCRNNQEMTPLLQLMEVSHGNMKDIIQLFVKNKVDMKAKDNEGRTALHVLCRNYTNDDMFDVAQLLIRNGVDFKAKDIYGRNALHILCRHYQKDNLNEIVRLLIDNKVDVNAKNNDGCTALHILCRHYQKDNLNEIVRLLIDNKVDVNAKNNDGWTALHISCRHYQKDNLNEIVRLLIQNKVDVNAKNNDGCTALHFLCGNYQKYNLNEIVRLLIQNKVDVNAKINDGLTALHILCRIYQKDNLNEIVRLLIDNKADVKAKTNDGWTALTLLCEGYKNENIIDIIRILIQHGVDVSAKNSDGFTAADCLKRNYDKSNKNEILKLFAGQ